MKKIAFILSVFFLAQQAFAQKLYTIPDDFGPEDSVTFVINVALCDNKSLVGHDPEDVYLWTWAPTANRPTEWTNSPNGGTGSWPDSNPNLKMTYMGDNKWSFKMKPTAFYGLTAGQVYAGINTENGLKGNFKMLAKSSTGNAQTEDLAFLILPPVSARKVVMFPDKVKSGGGELTDTAFIHMDDAVTVLYDKKQEQSDTIMSITEFSIVAEGKLNDGATVRVSLLKDVGANDKLRMKLTTDNIYRFSFIPVVLYKDVIPTGKTLASMQLKIVKTVIGGKPTDAQTVEDAQTMKAGAGSSKKSIFYIYPVE